MVTLSPSFGGGEPSEDGNVGGGRKGWAQSAQVHENRGSAMCPASSGGSKAAVSLSAHHTPAEPGREPGNLICQGNQHTRERVVVKSGSARGWVGGGGKACRVTHAPVVAVVGAHRLRRVAANRSESHRAPCAQAIQVEGVATNTPAPLPNARRLEGVQEAAWPTNGLGSAVHEIMADAS